MENHLGTPEYSGYNVENIGGLLNLVENCSNLVKATPNLKQYSIISKHNSV